MKKGKKMPSIELEGHSDARFTLKDGKIVRVDEASGMAEARGAHEHEPRGPHGP